MNEWWWLAILLLAVILGLKILALTLFVFIIWAIFTEPRRRKDDNGKV